MADYLDKYRFMFAELEKDTRVFRSHLSMVREHFREVEKMMVGTGLNVFSNVVMTDSSDNFEGYLIFDSLQPDMKRSGPGQISVWSSFMPFQPSEPTSGEEYTLSPIESAPYLTLIEAYRSLPYLVDAYIDDVEEVLEDGDNLTELEGLINKFRDFFPQIPSPS